MLWAAQKVCGSFTAMKCSVWMWMNKPGARIGTANSTSSRSNSNVAAVGSRALNATRLSPITMLKFGPTVNVTPRRSYAVLAATSLRSPGILSAARRAPRAGADSIRAARSITICISNELQFVEVVNDPVGLVFVDLGVPFANRQCRFHSGFPGRVQFSHNI